MRNLKKLLALTLALAMAFSLMLGASAADVKFEDYPDKDSITAEFTEGVQVLTGLKVFQGDEKGFRPSDKITRAEASAIIYRMATGDVDNRQNDLYKDYSTFVDVNSDDWFAGYVGYCQNAGYIKGTTPTTFNPYGQVTGYEVLAMILRVVGYGKNNEFTGGSWRVNVAALSRELGVTKNVTAAHMEQTLSMAAPREVVADLVFMTSTIVPTVTYTPALAYNDKITVTGGEYNVTLGQKTFGLYHDVEWGNIDRWGRPGYQWHKNGVRVGVTNASTGKAYMIRENHPQFGDLNSTSSVVATITAVPDYETLDQVRECDVAHALEEKGFGTSQTFRLYVNGDNDLDKVGIQTVTDDYKIVATDTVTKVGGQGRITEVYYNDGSPWFIDETRDVVMIDTFLAQVTGKADAKLDKNDHVITPAKLDVTIWDGNRKTSETVTAPEVNTPSKRVISKPSTSKENWDGYSVGDFILIYANTDKNAPDNSINDHVTGIAADLEKTAFETNKVVDRNGGTLIAGADTSAASTAKVLGKADVKQGKQTVVYYNANKHNLDSTDYNDQITLYLDRAGSNTNTTYNWYFDKNGYLIGIGDASSVNFGVITSIYAAFGQGESNTDGTAKAIATVKYADGTTGTVEIDRFLSSMDDSTQVDDGRYSSGTVTGNPTATVGETLNVASTGDNTVDLRPVYDTTSHDAMSADDPDVAFAPNGAAVDGWLYMAPAAATNRNAHFHDNGTKDVYGILYDNMYMFTTANDNAVVAVEVAGAGVNNQGLFLNLNNGLVGDADGNGTVEHANHIGMIYKNLGFVTCDAGVTTETGMTGNPGPATVYIDDETKIMVRTGIGSTNSNVVTYNGVSELPGNVVLRASSEIDWADTDGDGRAEYLYVTGNIRGMVTYGLFYYNGYTGGQAQWNGTTGTIPGYLNGKEETVTFSNKTLFDIVADTDNSYKGHLFALQLNNGVVSDVMFGQNNNSTGTGTAVITRELLNHTYSTYSNDSGAKVAASFADNIRNGVDAGVLAGAAFGLGTSNGNPYSTTTEAVYYRDSNANTADSGTGVHGTWEVSYNRDNTTGKGNTIEVAGRGTTVTYWITPNTNIVGELEWLNTRSGNDVTIVYDNQPTNGAAYAILDIYITPDPDVTPGDPDVSYSPTVSYDSNTSQYQLKVDRSAITSSAVNFNWNVYSCRADGTNAAAVLTNQGTGTIAAGAATVTAIQINGTTLNTGYYFVRISNITGMSDAVYNTAVFYVP